MAVTPSPAAKTERLLNLVICLLYTRQPLGKQAIRSAVPQYGDAASDEAFDRMFERDKDELRELGIPLRTEPLDAYFDDEPGYRIDAREYALPEIRFEADELAVLGLASRTWQQASLGGAAAQAMRKLQAEDVERDVDGVVGLEPRVRTTEPAFEKVKDAVMARRLITFAYRRAGQAESRRLQPWAVVNWHGNWYVTGYDLERAAPRVFRLSRIDGPVRLSGPKNAYEVPDDHDARAMVARANPRAAATRARLRVRVGAGNTLRRRAVPDPASAGVNATATTGPAGTVDAEAVDAVGHEAADTGWDTIVVGYTDLARLVTEVAGFGAAVTALEPPELVDAVRAHLTGVLSAAADPQPEGTA